MTDAALAAPPALLRAGQYLRVSLDKSGRQRSVEEQDNENREAAPGRGMEIVETYQEGKAISASRFSKKAREDFARLMDDLSAGKLDILILWEGSRGSRKVSEWARMIEICEEQRVKIFVTSHDHVYDPLEPRDRRTLMEDAVDAEYESGKTSKRVKRNARANAAAGLPHGKIPFGYDRLYHERTRRLIEQFPHPTQADVVKKIFADIAAGKSIKAITTELDAGDVPTKTGVPWTWSVVREIALNPTYIAKRSHYGVLTDATWPRLVDDATFYTVRRILTDPARKTTKPGKVRHLVSMIARCAECGGPMTVRNRPRKGEVYFCRPKSCAFIDKAQFEAYVVDLVLARLVETWDALTAAGDSDDAALLSARDEVARLRAELDELYDEVGAGRVSAVALARIEPQKLAAIEDAESRLKVASTPPALRPMLDGPKGQLRQRWDAAPVTARREVVKALMQTLVVHRNPVPGHRVPAHQRVSYTWR